MHLIPHVLRYQGFEVYEYGSTLDALLQRSGNPVAGEPGAFSTFAQLGLYFARQLHPIYALTKFLKIIIFFLLSTIILGEKAI